MLNIQMKYINNEISIKIAIVNNSTYSIEDLFT